MNIAVWIIQGILALMLLMAGIMKSTQPKDKLVKSLPWVNDFSLQTVRFIGISELLGAIGIVVPQLTGIYFQKITYIILTVVFSSIPRGG